ncbi:hypothetical protein MCAV_03570 [[Mycoplasma] cavipharyngis]|uniref:hypothetical protein n=1 Tax=[Mycoplasma] cavipharyngis TaxID=92757 RepID=UPI003704CE27
MVQSVDKKINNLFSHQAEFIFKDIIYKTFTMHDDLFIIFASLNHYLNHYLNKFQDQDHESKATYLKCLNIFKFNELFANHPPCEIHSDPKLFQLKLKQKWKLKSACKKAIKAHNWELSKNEKMYDLIYKEIHKYLNIFLKMTKYVLIENDIN